MTMRGAIQVALRFAAALNSMPLGWRVWIMGLIAVNLLVPVFFRARQEARVTMAVFLLQGVFMMMLFCLQGFTRLLGLAHFGWIGLVYWLWDRAWAREPRTAWKTWLQTLVIVDLASLSIDVADVLRYLLGERAPVG